MGSTIKRNIEEPVELKELLRILKLPPFQSFSMVLPDGTSVTISSADWNRILTLAENGLSYESS